MRSINREYIVWLLSPLCRKLIVRNVSPIQRSSIKTSLIVMDIMFGRTFFVLVAIALDNFCVHIYKGDYSPVIQKRAVLSFLFDTSVMTACFCERDNSPFLKYSFVHSIKGSLINGQNFL